MQSGDRTEATDSTSAGSGASDAGQVIGESAEKDIKLSEDLAASSEMAVNDILRSEMESLIMSEGLSCLEIDWLAENRPATLKNIRAERIGLEKITESLGITIMWHEHFRAKWLRVWKQLYDEHGTIALTHKWLTDRKSTIIYTSLGKHGMTMTEAIEHMGMTDESLQFKGPNSGRFRWTKEKFEEITKKIIKEFGCFPPGEFLDKHGYGGLRSNIGKFGPTTADIRKRHNVQNVVLQSMDGQIWLSLPETAFANHLIARGIKVFKGEPYAKEYAEKYNRKSAVYDMHFLGRVEPYINMKLSVEIFGSGNYGGDNIRKKHYAETRRFKEDFHKNDKTFVVIEYKDCYSDARLIELLCSYIGRPEVLSDIPNRFNTTMASLEEQVLQQCRAIKSKLQTPKLPTSAWFDRTGPYKNREVLEWEPKTFATLVRNIERIKFIEVRKMLGEDDIPSRRSWDEEDVVLGYKETVAKHGVPPVQLFNRLRCLKKTHGLTEYEADLISEMSKLRHAVYKHFNDRMDVLAQRANS